MIISPPFLSLSHVPVYDEQCVRSVMPGGIVGSGAFPVSQAMGWHGGLHLHAPTTAEPVRAIADGVVIFRRDGVVAGQPDSGNARYDGEDHSIGCVVIRHVTEIGAQGATPVTVTFYSITQHLRQLDAGLPAVGSTIYRKDILGLAGTIHGQTDRIHLEIVAGDADARKLIGRGTGKLGVSGDGRSDVVFGQIHVLVPAKTPYYSTQPTGTLPAAAGDTGNDDLVIGIRYAGGAELTTCKTTGEKLGQVSEPDAEYNLYTEATARHHRAPAGSSPSGWYELLRFGRNLGIDPLPAGAAHWRKVVVPGQANGVWIDLNAANTRKFSDADFPHWAGWTLIDDDVTDNDSRCDSALIDAMLASTPQAGAPAVLTPQQKAAERMRNLCRSEVQEKLARTICKFPTEWAKDPMRARWAWTRKTGNPCMPYPLQDEGDFTQMTDFAQKLCFWEELPEEDKARLTIKHWHFHPREFINQFRKCGWLSQKELTRATRETVLNKAGKEVEKLTRQDILMYLNNAGSRRPAGLHVSLQKTMQKYGINSPQRIACLLSQITEETGRFNFMVELGADSYFNKYEPGTDQGKKLGNSRTGDGKRFKGRGIIQITGRDNYTHYGAYKGDSGKYLLDADAASLGTDPLLTCDASGSYWASKQRMKDSVTKFGKLGINYWADQGWGKEDVRQVTKCINPGCYHFDEVRWPCFEHAWYVINDLKIFPINFKPIPD